MTVSIRKEEIIKVTKRKTKVEKKKFDSLITEIEEKTGFDKYSKNRGIIMSSSSSYQDFDIYNIFNIRFIEDRKEFLGFVHQLSAIYDLIKDSKDIPMFFIAFNEFINKLTEVLDIAWNENEKAKLNKINYFLEFYSELKTISDDVIVSFLNEKFYIKDINLMVLFENNTKQMSVDVNIDNQRLLRIELSKYTNDNLKKLKQLLEEKKIWDKLRSMQLSKVFKEEQKPTFTQRELEPFNDIYGYKFFEIKDRLLMYIDKAVPGDIFDILFTTIRRTETIYTPYMSFNIDYLKCEFGYYLIDLDNKCVIFKETREEIFNHCLNKLVISDTAVTNQCR